MPALFYLPKTVPLSTAGGLLPGAKITFTQTGTTTPQNTYQDILLTTPHANPVLADSAGVFAPIYLDPSLPDYRIKLTTSANVLVYQVDNYPSRQDTGQQFRLISAAPQLIFEETGVTANNSKWYQRAQAETFEIGLMNDAESVANAFILLNRSGTTIDGVTFTAGSFSFGGDVAITGDLTVGGIDAATVQSGSFSGPITGISDSVNVTVNWRIIGNIVFIRMENAGLGASNATTMTVTGAPVAIRPTRIQYVPTGAAVDNSASYRHDILVEIATSGVFTFLKDGDSNGWTASGTKSPCTANDNTFCYFLN